MCAGLGGKSTHLAELMGDRGRVLAMDTSLARLGGLRQNTERLGIRRIFPLAANVARPVSFFRGSIGKIMVDGPCSGLGGYFKAPRYEIDQKRG